MNDVVGGRVSQLQGQAEQIESRTDVTRFAYLKKREYTMLLMTWQDPGVSRARLDTWRHFTPEPGV
jgi:hypothetical protein